MSPATRTPEGEPNRCPICGKNVTIEPSVTTHDAPCPHCGSLLWFPDVDGVRQLFGFSRLRIQTAEQLSKEELIRTILRRMAMCDQVRHEDMDNIARAILKRESLGSTGIGRGLAIPHVTHPGVKKVTATIVNVSPAVDFDSLDGEAVQGVVLIISPVDRPGDHLRALEHITRRLRDASSL